MAFTLTAIGVSQSPGNVTFSGSWNGAGEWARVNFMWGYASFSFHTVDRFFSANNGNWSDSDSVIKDRAAKFRAVGTNPSSYRESTTFTFKTYADLASFPTGLTPGTPTTTTVAVTGSVIPNTNESSGSVEIEYRVAGSGSAWSTTGVIVSGLTGTGAIGLTGSITGLVPGTDYEARYKLTRNTANGTVAYSNTGIFTTQASTPVIISVPNIMETDYEMFAPSQVGAGDMVIEVPDIMEFEMEMLVPTIVNTSQKRIIRRQVIIATIVERIVVMD